MRLLGRFKERLKKGVQGSRMRPAWCYFWPEPQEDRQGKSGPRVGTGARAGELWSGQRRKERPVCNSLREILGVGGVRARVLRKSKGGKTGLRDIYERERQRGRTVHGMQTRKERGQRHLPGKESTSPSTCQNTCHVRYLHINHGKRLAELQFAAVLCVFSSPFVFDSHS